MEITKKFIKHIADLSRITLSEEEVDKFTPQMKTILESVNVLQEVDTNNVEPMKKHVAFKDVREDIPEKTLTQEEVLANAKYTELGHVKVYGKIFGAIEES
jgi:aspartyl-tRNA(Asn)/glutamyl-tRNA(Gln) amidotransferase subunit C